MIPNLEEKKIIQTLLFHGNGKKNSVRNQLNIYLRTALDRVISRHTKTIHRMSLFYFRSMKQ